MKEEKKNLIKKIASILLYTTLIIILFLVVVQKFSNNKLSLFGYRIFRVVSESMVPEYNINDILLVKQINAKDIKVGDNISYYKNLSDSLNIIVTHKVVDIEKDANDDYIFHTKGIANEVEDAIVRKEQVYGVVIYKIYLLSFINKIVNTIYGFILLVFIPLIIIIYSHIDELIGMIKEKKDEK